MTVTVVTPWHNAHELIPAYSAAINAAYPDAVLIVDNASEPPILAPGVIRQETNLGFNKANNVALHAAETDAVLFLNNDIVHTGPNWLDPIRSALKPGRLIGAQLRMDEHARIDGRLFPYLDGWCLAGMRADLLALGGWDETLDEPAYYGDNLLSLRAQQAGMKLVQVNVALRHLRDYTSNRMDPQHKIDVTMANRARFIKAAREVMRAAA